MQKYVLYVDHGADHARVHKIECGHYINRKAETQPNNGWCHGPYTLEEAKSALCDLGKTSSGPCGNCFRKTR